MRLDCAKPVIRLSLTSADFVAEGKSLGLMITSQNLMFTYSTRTSRRAWRPAKSVPGHSQNPT
jgi:hypothetical protein